MTTKTTNKLKKILAMVLAFAVVMGIVPITAMGADPMQVTFVSGQNEPLPLGDYLVGFALGHFPDSYEADEGQENLVFSQYVTVMSGGGLVTDGLFMPPVDIIPGVTIPTDLPPVLPDEDEPEDEDYENGYGDYGNGYNDGYVNGEGGNGYAGDNGTENGNGYSDGGENSVSGEDYPPNGEAGYTNGNDTYGNGTTQQTGGENGAYEQTDPDPTDGLENSVALVWYLDGERRTDKGTFSTSADLNWLPGDIIPMELRFDEVTAADMGVWTLRAYSYGEWVESPYALFLQVGEVEPIAGIVPMVAGEVVIGLPGVTDTVPLIQSAIAAELTAGRDVTVTGTFTDANATLSINILAGRTVTWNATISGDVDATLISITGSGTFVVEGGTIANTRTVAGSWSSHAIQTPLPSAVTVIINGGIISTAMGGGVPAVFMQSSSAGTAFVITGGTFSAGSAVVIQINTNSTLYLSGGNVTPAGGIRQMGGTAFYTGDNTALFGTAGGVALFTPGTNLFRLDDIVLSHPFDPITPADGTVTATFLAGFNITSVTANPATATHSFAGNVVTFGGDFNHNNITLTVSGTLTNGNLTVPAFTTAPFGVNTEGSAMHTVTFNLNGGTRTGGGELVQQIVDGANAFPPTASLAGYIFDGWDGGLYTNITSGRTLTAQWTPLPGLQINDAGNHTTLAAFQTAINAALAPSNAVVNVTGGLAFADATLAIDIQTGRTVNWNANYSGSVGAGSLINITGGGAFNLTGGTIEQLGGATAVLAAGDIRFTMSGGNIHSDSANMHALRGFGNSEVLITGGRIELRNSSSDSILQATGNSIVRITGGLTLARANVGNAIGAMITSTVVITGNPSLPGGLNPTANGLIIQHPGTGTYGIGEAVTTATFNTLAANPNAATAVWALQDGRSGMTYTTTTDIPRTRFVEVDGVTAVPTFAITINGGGTGYSASPNPAQAGATVTLNPGTIIGYMFTGWTVVSGGITIAANNTFTMPNNPVEVTANWRQQSTDNTAHSLTAQPTGRAGVIDNTANTITVDLPNDTADQTIEVVVANYVSWSITGAVVSYYDGEYTVTLGRGTTIVNLVVTPEDGETRTYTVTLTTLHTVTNFTITGIAAPVAGAATDLPTVPDCPNGQWAVSGRGWMQWANGQLAGSNFTAGHFYRFDLFLSPAAGWTFGDTAPVMANVTVQDANGEPVTILSMDNSILPDGRLVLRMQFPRTAATITNLNIVLPAPVTGETPVTEVTNAQWTAAVEWRNAANNLAGTNFAPNTIYTANITVTAQTGFTLVGFAANSFTVNGGAPTTGNSAGSGVLSHTFTATGRANPDVTWPSNLTATFGQTLGDVSFGANTGTAGSFTWTAGNATSVGAVGPQQHNVTFTPTDTATYNTVNNDVTVTVGRITPTAAHLEYDLTAVTFDNAPRAVSVTPASGVTGLGTITVEYAPQGTTNWTTDEPINAGTYQVRANIAEGTNFTAAIISLGSFTIIQATGLTATPPTTTVKAGEATIANFDLNTILLNHPTLTPLNTGARTFSAVLADGGGFVSGVNVSDNTLTFAVADTATDGNTATITITINTTNFESITTTLTITARDLIVPTATANVTGSLTFGQSLSNLLIAVATSSTPGTIAWNNPDAIPNVGAPPQAWTFTPTDQNTYATLHGASAITVNPAQVAGTVVIDVTGTGVGGSVVEGNVMTANVSGITPAGAQAGLTFQWFRGGAAIGEATNNTYTVTAADMTQSITVQVTGTGNFAGSQTSAAVEVGRIPLGGTISISGTTTLGDVLTLNRTALVPTNANVTITWLRDGTSIAGAVGESYTIAQADLGRVIAVQIVGTGDYTGSAVSPSVNIPAVVPTEPRNFTATPGNAQVALAWNAPEFDGGAAITGFQVSSDNGTTWVASTSNTGHVFTGLTNGIAYTFRVRAINSAGNGEYAAAVATPTAVIAVTGVSISQNNFSLQVGQNNQLIATVTPANAANTNVTWDSNNSAVATVNAAGLVTAVAPGTATITVTTADGGFTDTVQVTVTQAQDNNNQGGDHNGGGGGEGEGGTTWTPPANATHFTINGITMNFTVSNNIATLQMSDAVVTQIINAARNANQATVSFNLSNLQGRSNLTGVQMSSVALERFANANLAVEIRLPNGTIHLDDVAAANAAEQAGANIVISLGRLTNVQRNQLNNAQRAALSNNDVIFRITMASGNIGISNFGDGVVTATLPFTGTFPAAVWYLDNSGNLHRMESTYNRTARTVIFTTNHLSLFVVGHDDGTRNEIR